MEGSEQGYVRDRGEEHSNQCGLSAAWDVLTAENKDWV